MSGRIVGTAQRSAIAGGPGTANPVNPPDAPDDSGRWDLLGVSFNVTMFGLTGGGNAVPGSQLANSAPMVGPGGCVPAGGTVWPVTSLQGFEVTTPSPGPADAVSWTGDSWMMAIWRERVA